MLYTQRGIRDISYIPPRHPHFEELDGPAVSALSVPSRKLSNIGWSSDGWPKIYYFELRASEGILSRWSRLYLPFTPTNPHWTRVVGYGPFSLWVIHKEGLCPSSEDINRLMMMTHILPKVLSYEKHCIPKKNKLCYLLTIDKTNHHTLLSWNIKCQFHSWNMKRNVIYGTWHALSMIGSHDIVIAVEK
jgi:hypothetical protein